MISLGLITLGAAPLTACAQTPGTRLQGAVELVGLEMHGDTLSARYRVRADATTPEPFFSLTLPLPEFALTVRADTADRFWHSSNRVGRRSVASWAYIGEAQMLVSPPLVFSAIGVPELADAGSRGTTSHSWRERHKLILPGRTLRATNMVLGRSVWSGSDREPRR